MLKFDLSAVCRQEKTIFNDTLIMAMKSYQKTYDIMPNCFQKPMFVQYASLVVDFKKESIAYGVVDELVLETMSVSPILRKLIRFTLADTSISLSKKEVLLNNLMFCFLEKKTFFLFDEDNISNFNELVGKKEDSTFLYLVSEKKKPLKLVFAQNS